YTLQDERNSKTLPRAIDGAPIHLSFAYRKTNCFTSGLHCLRDITGELGVDLLPEAALCLDCDLIDWIAGAAANHHQRLRRRSATRHRQFSFFRKALLFRCRTDQNRREQLLAEELDCKVQLHRVDHQARPESDAIESLAIAACD